MTPARRMKPLPRIAIEPPGDFRPFADDEIEQSVPQRFEQQVRAFGDGLAIRSDRVSYTYASLNQTANRWACTMIARMARRVAAALGDGQGSGAGGPGPRVFNA